MFKPTDQSAEGRAAFQQTVDQLLRLRGVGLIRLPEGRIMRAEDGSYLMAGPCDLTRRASRRSRTTAVWGPAPHRAVLDVSAETNDSPFC